MGILDKITSRTISKTTNRMADKISDGIVNGLFGKKKGNDRYDDSTGYSDNCTSGDCPPASAAAYNAAAMQASVNVTGLGEGLNSIMGMAYNTKKCPECNAVCVNSPVTCPYCGADLKSVKPMTPEEMAAIKEQ